MSNVSVVPSELSSETRVENAVAKPATVAPVERAAVAVRTGEKFEKFADMPLSAYVKEKLSSVKFAVPMGPRALSSSWLAEHRLMSAPWGRAVMNGAIFR